VASVNWNKPIERKNNHDDRCTTERGCLVPAGIDDRSNRESYRVKEWRCHKYAKVSLAYQRSDDQQRERYALHNTALCGSGGRRQR
jgi:hypothetical protein